MVKTWTASIVPLYDEERYRRYYTQAPFFRREKAERYKNVQMRAQSIGVWMLYERMKKEYGVTENAIYNLSHSGDYVLCSVGMNSAGDFSVGCDVEEEKDFPDLKIARRFFCAAEYEKIMEETDQERQRVLFYRYWVLKESFVKATREGLKLGMDTFEIALGNPPVLVRQPEQFPQPYYYLESSIYGERDRYRIAVCSTDPEMEEVRQVQFGKEL